MNKLLSCPIRPASSPRATGVDAADHYLNAEFLRDSRSLWYFVTNRRSLKKLHRLVGFALATLAGIWGVSAQAADEELKIGVVAAESGSFVSAGNTIVAAAKLAFHTHNDAARI